LPTHIALFIERCKEMGSRIVERPETLNRQLDDDAVNDIVSTGITREGSPGRERLGAKMESHTVERPETLNLRLDAAVSDLVPVGVTRGGDPGMRIAYPGSLLWWKDLNLWELREHLLCSLRGEASWPQKETLKKLDDFLKKSEPKLKAYSFAIQNIAPLPVRSGVQGVFHVNFRGFIEGNRPGSSVEDARRTFRSDSGVGVNAAGFESASHKNIEVAPDAIVDRLEQQLNTLIDDVDNFLTKFENCKIRKHTVDRHNRNNIDAKVTEKDGLGNTLFMVGNRDEDRKAVHEHVEKLVQRIRDDALHVKKHIGKFASIFYSSGRVEDYLGRVNRMCYWANDERFCIRYSSASYSSGIAAVNVNKKKGSFFFANEMQVRFEYGEAHVLADCSGSPIPNVQSRKQYDQYVNNWKRYAKLDERLRQLHKQRGEHADLRVTIYVGEK